MTPFEEADARVGGMHGYEARERAMPEGAQTRTVAPYETAAARNAQITGAALVTTYVGDPPASTSVRKSDVVEIQKHLERLEAKLDALVVALRAGAVGKWTP